MAVAGALFSRRLCQLGGQRAFWRLRLGMLAYCLAGGERQKAFGGPGMEKSCRRTADRLDWATGFAGKWRPLPENVLVLAGVMGKNTPESREEGMAKYVGTVSFLTRISVCRVGSTCCFAAHE